MSDYAQDPWNYVELFSFISYFIGLALQHGYNVRYDEAARIFRAFSFMWFAYQIIRYGSVFETFGVLIPVLEKMVCVSASLVNNNYLQAC